MRTWRARAEDFLELVERGRRGRLKLYIGFAAGVGKTYRMLEEAQRHLLANLDKARELGAEVVRLRGKDPVEALLDFARSHGVGHIIVGRSHQPWWKQVLGRAADVRLIREGKGFDIHVVAFELPDEERRP